MKNWNIQQNKTRVSRTSSWIPLAVVVAIMSMAYFVFLNYYPHQHTYYFGTSPGIQEAGSTPGRAGSELTFSGPCEDIDSDGYNASHCGGRDCNDTNPSIHPGALEICGNGIDEDCDALGLDCHPADNNTDGSINMQELTAYIELWKQDSTAYPMPGLMGAIEIWNAGLPETHLPDEPIPIIPNATGFGIYTRAGFDENTTVYKVTNLKSDASPGTLGACIAATGSRVCVFEVSGTIDVSIHGCFDIKHKDKIVIAGQTAPAPGITIKGCILARANDILIQHLRIRQTDEPYLPVEPLSNIALRIQAPPVGYGDSSNRIIIDHCSISWGIDANAALTGVNDLTVSNSIISEALYDSIHQDGPHSMGIGIYDTSNVALINNLISQSCGRNPRVSGSNSSLVFANNIVYVEGTSEHRGLTAPSGYQTQLSFIGDRYIFNQRGSEAAIYTYQGDYLPGSGLYIEDIAVSPCQIGSCVDWECTIPWASDIRVDSPLIEVPDFEPMPGDEVEDYIINNAGAYPAFRDLVDARIISDLQNRTGKIVDCIDSDPIYYPIDYAEGGSANTIILSPLNEYKPVSDNRYNSKTIEITEGTCAGQSRVIEDYSGGANGTRTAATTEPWTDCIPDNTSFYRIINDCSNNAGGWPVLAENYRELTLPENPNGDDDGDGYTNLEEWLHGYAELVEGKS